MTCDMLPTIGGAIAALKALRADLIDPKTAEHHGRVVKLTGDGRLSQSSNLHPQSK